MKEVSQSRVSLFGKLRAFASGGYIRVPTYPEMTPQEFREAVAKVLADGSTGFPGVSELLSSAVVSGDRIVSEKEPIGTGEEFALLPPVCGG